MTVIFRGPTFLQVTIDGQHVTTGNSGGVLSARVSLGYDLQAAEAEVNVPVVPSWANIWSKVQVEMGASQATSQTRFVGYLVQIERDLYPRAAKLVCRGYLIKAVMQDCDATDGVDFSNSGAGQTDATIIGQILDTCGLTTGVVGRSLSGTGATIGAVATPFCRWQNGETGLDFIARLDAICLGYRTFDSIGGTIIRQKITSNPSGSASLTFTEGVDIFRGNSIDTVLDAKNRMVVSGYNDGQNTRTVTIEQQSSFVPNNGYVTATLQNPLIERENAADSGTGISCEDVANWQLGELNRRIYKVTLTTPRDDLIAPGATIAIVSPSRLGFNQNFWVQHVEPSVDEQGQFGQVLICIAGSGGTAPIVESPIADFTMRVTEAEQVLVGNTQGVLYTVNCTDSSAARSGSIGTWTWTASGGGVPASSSGSAFTVGFSDISSATITLTVTDSNGLSDTIVKNVPDTAVNTYVQRKIYTCGSNYIEDFDGSTWRTQSVTSAYAPEDNAYWISSASVLHSTTGLKTTVTSSTPFSGSVNVTAIQCLAWVDPTWVIVGGNNGQVAYSSNSGGTWTVVNGPSSDPVEEVVYAYNDKTKWWVLTSKGLYLTTTSGASWTTMTSATGSEVFRGFLITNQRWVVCMANGRLMCDTNGTSVYTFPTLTPPVTDIYAVEKIYNVDGFFCYDSLGRVFTTSAAGAWTMVAAANNLPATCQPQIRGLAGDSVIYSLYYFAGGTDGIWKTLDSFATTGGMMRLRQPGVAGSPTDAVYTRVRPDSRYSAPTNDGLRVLVTGSYGGSPMAYYTQDITAAPVTWVPVSTTGLPPSGTLYAPTLNPAQTHQAFVRVDKSAIYTNIAVFEGATWTPVLLGTQVTDLVNAGYDGVLITDFAVTSVNSNLYVVATTLDTYNGVAGARHRFWMLMTTNGGSSWQVTEFGTEVGAASSSIWTTDNGFCGASVSAGQHVAGVVYCLVSHNGTGSDGTGDVRVYASTNSGATLTSKLLVNSTWSARHQIVCPTDTNANDQEAMVFLANDNFSSWPTANGSYHTTNLGTSWSSGYTTNAHAGPVFVDPGNSSNWYLYEPANTSVYTSTNRAVTFSNTNSIAPKMAHANHWAIKHKAAGGLRHYAVGQSASGHFSRVMTSPDLSVWTACDGNLPGDGYSDGLLYGIAVDPNA